MDTCLRFNPEGVELNGSKEKTMSTYTQIIYHIVFSTKDRQNTLDYDHHEELFKYIWGILKNRECHLYRINGHTDHVHILTSLHPSLALADFIKDIKIGTSKWIRTKPVFKDFESWQKGYAAFTHSVNDKNDLIDYIKSQKEHHRQLTFKEELIDLLSKANIEFDMKYLE
ncbi:MAG: IS200/IS605 family transposase [Planctomycetaceae bacterium]|nr:IS200/IS605 family transposase [Planctomycetaceae bacterium]